MGYFDWEGYLFVRGRKTDSITQGEKIICFRDIEDMILENFCSHVVVVSIVQLINGLGAVVIPAINVDLNSLDVFIQESVKSLMDISIKVLILSFSERFPVNANGKIDKKLLVTYFDK